MAGWPIIERSDDGWLVQSLRSGQEAASEHFYDLYAVRLFDYCHVLVRDEEAAGSALLDSLIIVRERIGDLEDPARFRGRLYAVTREQCLRRRSKAERRRAAEAVGSETDEATRRLMHSALLVLTGRQREALDLALRHGLTEEELAEVLQMTPQDAAAFIGQARHELTDALIAVDVATTGRDDCPSVAALAGAPGRTLDAETCGRLSRHITNCPICGTRGGDRRFDTERLLNAMPFAAIPVGLRESILTTACDPQYADLRATIVMSAAPTAAVADEPAEPRESSRRWPPVLAAAGTGLLVLCGIWFALPDSGSKNASHDQSIASRPGAIASDIPSAPESDGPLPSDSATSPSPSPSTSSGTPTPTPTPRVSGSMHPHSRRPSSPTSNPVVPPADPGPPAPGTLVVSGCSIRGSRSCTVTVTAQGGPVNWWVTGTHGSIRASGSGSLAAGQSAGVTATLTATICIGHGSGSVSFSSGATANVDYRC